MRKVNQRIARINMNENPAPRRASLHSIMLLLIYIKEK